MKMGFIEDIEEAADDMIYKADEFETKAVSVDNIKEIYERNKPKADDTIYLKELDIINAEYNNKWKKTDKRRIIFLVRFNNGTIWYPKNSEIFMIREARDKCFSHNIQFKNIDNEDETNGQR